MLNVTRLATAAVLLGLLSTPVLAAGAKLSPAGAWQSSDGQARVRVTLCGDGTQLCAKLVGLSGEARTAENLKLLNSYVVEGAALTDTNAWRGTVHLNGQTAEGHINLISANTISVSGCQMGLCKTFTFIRIGAPAAVADVAGGASVQSVRLAAR